MFWFCCIPFVVVMVFRDMYLSGFPDFHYVEPLDRSFLSWVFFIFVSVFISALISGALVGIAAMIGSLPDRTGVADKDYPLVALRQQDGVQGQFFLGSGMVGSDEYYFWYRRNDDGSIAGDKTYRSTGVKIFQGDHAPVMRTFKTEYTSHLSVFFYIFGYDFRDDADWTPYFFIPAGSIKEGFTL